MEVLGLGKRNYFEPPPLRRSFPWKQDGSGQCDLIAGGVDESGIFKGIYVSGVHIMALMRTFQLSKAFLPVDLPTPLATLGQSLRDGIPLILVTRGCFGRALDFGAGPDRNNIQQAVWDKARAFRAEMPQVLITCIDVPNHVGSDVIQACLAAPLNEYRELMYQDGTWYTPALEDTKAISKWQAENQREAPEKKGGVTFARKKFGWISEEHSYGNSYVVGWKPVLQVKPPTEILPRTDLIFTPGKPKSQSQVIDLNGPSSAQSTLHKALAIARQEPVSAGELLAAVKAYSTRATVREKDTIEESVKVCEEVTSMFQARGELEEAFTAKGLLVRFKLLLDQVAEAKQVADGLVNGAQTVKQQLEAAQLLVMCYYEMGDADKALEAALAGKAVVEAKGDAQVLKKAWTLVAEAYSVSGDEANASKAAAEARR